MRGISRPIAESDEQSENCGHHAPPSSVYALTVLEAAEIATIGRSTLYKYIRSGALPVRKIGTRTIILADDLVAFLRDRPHFRPRTIR